MSGSVPGVPHESMLRFLDHQLSVGEVGTLVDRLRADETARRQAAALLLQIGVLGELGRASADDLLPWRPRRVHRPRQPRWRTAAVAVGACLLAAAAILLFIRPGRPARTGHRSVLARTAGSRAPASVLPASVAGGAGALLVRGGPEPADAGDRTMLLHLEALGFAVTQVLDETVSNDDFTGKALVVISASTSREVMRARLPDLGLRDAPVPIVTCESSTFDLLGMTGPRRLGREGLGSAPGHTDLQIEAPGHVLAAGLQGVLRVASAPVPFSWGTPSEGAIRVASLGSKSRDLMAQFAYERGTAMVGATAPARRVGCFISTEAGDALTGEGWQLFDAGVRWAAGF